MLNLYFNFPDSKSDGRDGLETLLIVSCWLFALLLVLSVTGYAYLRFRMVPQLQRLPSDHHELTMQGPFIEVVQFPNEN